MNGLCLAGKASRRIVTAVQRLTLYGNSMRAIAAGPPAPIRNPGGSSQVVVAHGLFGEMRASCLLRAGLDNQHVRGPRQHLPLAACNKPSPLPPGATLCPQARPIHGFNRSRTLRHRPRPAATPHGAQPGSVPQATNASLPATASVTRRPTGSITLVRTCPNGSPVTIGVRVRARTTSSASRSR